MIFIKDYINQKLEDLTSQELASSLGISVAMLSTYKRTFSPSIKVAIKAYEIDGVVLHPYAKESLDYEIGKTDVR